MKRNGPKTPAEFHGAFGLTSHPSEKANALLIAWETISHYMACSTETINDKWRLDFKPCIKL
jgi:hypothetical protein